ncbi:MAG TPA: PAS domain S-box protein [Kiritimatiellia bacterium]|nr:PAS domain S-box protein [Kiritimatiellia bacterium]HSA19628.1 PAS domain S-box protein [Kiritimatiellia bacterium]
MTASSSPAAAFFKSLVLSLDLPVIVMDAELRVLLLNPAAEGITGARTRQAVGQFGGELVGMDRATCEALGFGSGGGATGWKEFVCVPAGSASRLVRARGCTLPWSARRTAVVWILDAPGWHDAGPRLLPSGAPVIIFELDAGGRLVYGAEEFAGLLDRQADVTTGRLFRELLVEEQRGSFDAVWRKAHGGEAVRNSELRLVHGRGAARPFWVSLFPIKDPRGITLGVRGVAGDLSGQKDLAYALEASEERFSVLFRESSDPILILNMEGDILLANPSFERITGVRSDELFSGEKSWSDFVLPADYEALRGELRQCAATHKDGMTEFRARDAGGQVVWFEQSHSILHDEVGQPRGIMAVARNIHRHKQHEFELREQAEDMQRRHDRAQALISRLKLFFAQTSSLADDPQRFLQGVCDILFEMYEPLLVILHLSGEGRVVHRGRPDVLADVGPEALEQLQCGVCGQITETGMPFYSHSLDTAPPPQCAARLGSRSLKTCVGAPLRDSSGRIRGSIIMLDDKTRAFDSLDVEVVTVAALQVAARLRAEEQETVRRGLEEHLRQAQKMEAVGMLAGGIAHDFNNILSSILGFTTYLLARTPPGSNIHRDLGLIEQSAVRAADLTRQLLSFARRRHFAKEPVSFNTVIHDVVAILRRSLPANIQIHMRLAPELPPVLGDRGQLNQVIMNMGINAAEAMSGKVGMLTLSTEHRALDLRERAVLAEAADEKYICVTVSDTGKGIPKEAQARIFDPFFTTKAASGGTGLGLSIVYGIVTNHKGFVHVESEETCGTTFRLYFPACESGDTSPEKAPSGRVLTGTETILVVEDEALVRQMAVEVLKSYGYKVVSASSGEEAVDLFKDVKDRVDLVFLDLVMPGMGGEETFQALRQEKADVKILLTSGFVREDLSERLVAAGALGILYKPAKSDDLLAAVRDALDGRPVTPPPKS